MRNLILMGSPRKNGTSAFIANWFANRLRNSEVITVSNLEINPCNGCESCKESGSCVFNDSMNLVYEKIKEAEHIIIILPIYFLGLPSILKALVDRTQLFWHHPLKKDKKALIYMLGEMPNTSLKEYYRKIWEYTLKNWGVKDFFFELLGKVKKRGDISENSLEKGLKWLDNENENMAD